MAIYKIFENNQPIRENKKRRKIKESFEDDQQVIINMAIDNGFIADMAELLEISNKIEKTNNGWAYMRGDYSGRDFFDDIPLQYIDSDEEESIKEYCLLDSDIESYDWGEFSDDIDYVQEALEDDFIDMLIEYLEGKGINESKKRKNIKEAKEKQLDKTDLKTLLTAVKTTLDYFDYHNKNLTKKQDYVLDDLKDVYQEIKNRN